MYVIYLLNHNKNSKNVPADTKFPAVNITCIFALRFFTRHYNLHRERQI